eukprot:1190948-Prorocentrum_minimum.AAC.2
MLYVSTYYLLFTSAAPWVAALRCRAGPGPDRTTWTKRMPHSPPPPPPPPTLAQISTWPNLYVG